MLNILILWFLNMNLAFLLNNQFKRKFGHATLVSLFTLVLAIYILAIIGLYPYILWIIYGIQIPILVYNILYYKNHFSEVKEIVKSPSFAYSIFTSVFAIFFFRNHFVSSWDEFSHWGLYVKNIVANNSIWNSNFTSVANGYPPIISIFQAFVIKLFGDYQESVLYSSLFILNTAIFMPIMDYLNWKNIKKIVFIFILAISIPCCFSVEYFDTIYVDFILGGIFGIILFIFLKEKTSISKFIESSILLSVLVLTKEFGIVFLGTFYLLLFLDFALFRKEEYKDFFKNGLSSIWSKIGFILLLLLPIFIRGTWYIYVHTIYPASTQMDTILTSSLLPPYAKRLFLTYFKSLRFTFISTGGSYLAFSLLNWFLVFLLLFEILKQVLTKKEEKTMLLAQLTVLITFGLYIAGLFLSYLFIFDEYEALRLASYARYLSSLLGAVLIFFFCSQFVYLEKIKKNTKKTKTQILFYLFFIGLMGTLPLRFFIASIQNNVMKQDKIDFQNQYESIYKLSSEVEKDDQVYFVSIENDGFRYWIARYLLTPIHIQSDGYWSLGEPSYEDDIWAQDISVEDFHSRLEKFNYIYLDHVNEGFIKKYSSIFEDSNDIKDNCLYEYDGKAKLKKCF